jgi:succinoglycan biosynthesis protein ExoA
VLPLASVAIPVRNEERTIEACLASVLAQDYPHDRLEILVLDGGSTDRTREVVEAVARGSAVPIRLLASPGRTVPAALNVALGEARGDFLVRVDGHSEPDVAYVRRSVEAGIELGADLAGGWVEAFGTTRFGRAVAAAFTSPFAMGYAMSWRPPAAPTEVASVPCGAYRIESLRRIGGFDEGQHANQDYEANYRLRLAGGKIVLLPDVKFRYETRSSPRRLWRQFLRYGFYKARTMAKHPPSVRPRHLVPAAMLLLGAALVLAAVVWAPARRLLVAVVALYAAGLLAAAFAARRRAEGAAYILPLVFATMHFGWGLGNLAGLVRWFPVRASLR